MAVVLDSWAAHPGACGDCTGAWRCLRLAYLDTDHHVCGSGAELELYWWLYWLCVLWQCRIFPHGRVCSRAEFIRHAAVLVRTSLRRARRCSLRPFILAARRAAPRPLLRLC